MYPTMPHMQESPGGSGVVRLLVPAGRSWRTGTQRPFPKPKPGPARTGLERGSGRDDAMITMAAGNLKEQPAQLASEDRGSRIELPGLTLLDRPNLTTSL